MNEVQIYQQAQQGLTYEEYLAYWREQLEQPITDKDQRRLHFYRSYNMERSERVAAAYSPSPRLAEALACIPEPQLWIVLTEAWCGDSAFCLPVIAAAAASTPNIELRILLRDDHLEIMDQYLTDGGRSVPKLVAFDTSGEQCFTWGPRPEPAHAMRARMKAEGAGGKTMTNALVEWYEAGGWEIVDEELAAALEATVCAR